MTIIRQIRNVGRIFCVVALVGSAFWRPAMAEEVKVVCPDNPPKQPEISRAQVYAETPFKAGEQATYVVSYSGLKAGYATMTVKPPMRHNGLWSRIFHAEATTGDWFKTIFVGHDKVEAYSRPSDFGIVKFYMEQFEQPVFSSPMVAKKWLDFDHEKCKVKERTWKPEKGNQDDVYDLAPGAIDALGVVYYMRTLNYKVGKVERAPVYTSEKNWFLEAAPLALEKITVGAGTFDTVKMKLTTFLGKELQQKGDVYVWIATGTKERQVVQIQGKIKIGSVWMALDSFKPGS